jgi:hypothetical protein
LEDAWKQTNSPHSYRDALKIHIQEVQGKALERSNNVVTDPYSPVHKCEE